MSNNTKHGPRSPEEVDAFVKGETGFFMSPEALQEERNILEGLMRNDIGHLILTSPDQRIAFMASPDGNNVAGAIVVSAALGGGMSIYSYGAEQLADKDIRKAIDEMRDAGWVLTTIPEYAETHYRDIAEMERATALIMMPSPSASIH